MATTVLKEQKQESTGEELVDPPAQQRQSSSLLSQITYTYFNGVLKKGTTTDLSHNDFAPIEDSDRAKEMAEAITAEWHKQGQQKSLLKVLIAVYGKQYASVAPLFIAELIIQMSQGVFLAQLLVWAADPTRPVEEGYWYAAGISLDALLYGLAHHTEWFVISRIGMQVRVGLIATIYQKCLGLSLADTSSTGYIVNLVSNDVQRFEDVAPFLHYLYITPLQIIGFMTLIYYQIGWSAFAAVGAVLMFIPIQTIFGAYFKIFRKVCVEYRDERIKSISDMVLGVFVVKLYNWEMPFMKRVMELRGKEMKLIWASNVLKSLNDSIFFSSGIIINLITFTAFYFTGGVFTAAKVFSTIVYLNVLKLSLTNFIPKAVQMGNESLVSIERIEKFLMLSDITLGSDETLDESSDLILEMKHASFTWIKDSEDNVLSDISLVVKKGSLNVITGRVGAGKSSILHSILRDTFQTSGDMKLNVKRLAYVSQASWILAGSIKENILFGLKYDEARFLSAVAACSLARDISQFPDGINTFVGERGVTLSGGQRARVALARAVYSDADLYLMDDCLSAVDTKVARHLFQKCIKEALIGKTVVLITHQIQFLSQVDQIIVVDNGRVVETGTYTTLAAGSSIFSMTLKDLNQQSKSEIDNPKLSHIPTDFDDDIALAVKESEAKQSSFSKEEVFKGGVTFKTYFNYFKASGLPKSIILCILIIIPEALYVITDFWLSSWSAQTAILQSESKWYSGFLSLSLLTIFFSAVRGIIFAYACYLSSTSSFKNMLEAVFHSPMQFFQMNPHGRTINRFSKDMNLADESLPQTFFDLVQCTTVTFGIIIVSVIVVPWLLIVYPFMIWIFISLRNYYMKTVRQVKRIEAITRSPVYSAIPSTLEGLSTIRAFNAKERFRIQFFSSQNNNTKMFFAYVTSGRWLGMRLDFITALLIAFIIFLIIPLKSILNLTPSLIGLLISYLLNMTGTLQWAVRQFTEVESLMTSVERIQEYGKLPNEGALKSSLNIPQDWPDQGLMELEKMSLTYPQMQNEKVADPVLKNVSFSVQPGSKIGIVGRTGAGKSSLLQAVFRIVEPTPKSIKIDGVYTSDLGLDELRSKISVIPQEPFCFKGTLRFNLDPFGRYTDEQLWDALGSVQLKPTVLGNADKLEAEVAENGSNWSVGERQLICLARAILSNKKIVFMDESTSSIDLKTDQIIIKIMKELFADKTVLTIAHRLETIISYDKILVLEKGEVVEYGSPATLLAKPVDQPDAWFSRMVNEMGPEASANLIKLVGA